MPSSATAILQPTKRAIGAQSRRGVGAVTLWLFGCCALIFLMVVVGGITRLTLSGLSITEWKPVVGVLPPLSAANWAAEFTKYQQIPQYQLVQNTMTLAEFKSIYFWEYLHRLLGRLIGVAYAVPFVWFLVHRRLPRRLALPLAGIFLLGIGQGALGWYMVQSGLADRVDVSQYRLVAHLALALLIYAAILWVALGIVRPSRSAHEAPVAGLDPRIKSGADFVAISGGFRRCPERPPVVMAGLDPAIHAFPNPRIDGNEGVDHRVEPGDDDRRSSAFASEVKPGWRRAAEAVIFLVALTIAAGGLVAGTHAGLIYNTFPLMDGNVVPNDYVRLHPLFLNWFENVAAIQFDHRVLALATTVLVVLVWAAGLRAALPRPCRLALHALLVAAALQVALGIATLVLVLPIPLAIAHQAGAIVLLTTALVLRHTMHSAR